MEGGWTDECGLNCTVFLITILTLARDLDLRLPNGAHGLRPGPVLA